MYRGRTVLEIEIGLLILNRDLPELAEIEIKTERSKIAIAFIFLSPPM